ncbi:unnamed protein product, partial [Callosobruchus maculatus]
SYNYENIRADKTSKCFLRRTVRDHIIPITYAHGPFNKYAICDIVINSSISSLDQPSSSLASDRPRCGQDVIDAGTATPSC